MSNLLTLGHFSSLLQRVFQVREDEIALDLTLIDASALRSPPDQPREPFALLFRGPSQPILAQGIHRMHTETLGTLEIFLVPIGPDGIGQRYEAIFN
jgi:Domain of unknown function (DUF6916)